MRFVIAAVALAASLPVCAQETSIAVLQMEDGSRQWRFEMKAMLKRTDDFILGEIRRLLGAAHACEQGWEIVDSTSSMGLVTISGRCK